MLEVICMQYHVTVIKGGCPLWYNFYHNQLTYKVHA